MGAAGLLVSADKKLAMEALAKVLGGPVSASAAPAPTAAAAASRPGTAASTRAAPSRAGAASRAGASRPGTAAPAAAAAAAVAAPEAGGPILAYSEGKADRARKVRRPLARLSCIRVMHGILRGPPALLRLLPCPTPCPPHPTLTAAPPPARQV